jgi:hypothetical protein
MILWKDFVFDHQLGPLLSPDLFDDPLTPSIPSIHLKVRSNDESSTLTKAACPPQSTSHTLAHNVEIYDPSL